MSHGQQGLFNAGKTLSETGTLKEKKRKFA